MSTSTDHDNRPDRSTEVDSVAPTGSRRALVLGSAGAAAAAAAVLAGGSSRVAADDGDALAVGRSTTAETRTELVGPSFVVTDGDASGSLARNQEGTITGVFGFTADSTANRAVWGLDQTGDGVGVYGQHDGTSTRAGPGTGVVASSDSGPGLDARGTTYDAMLRGTGQLNMVSAGALAADNAGPVGTLARSDDGSLWFSVGDNEWSRVAAQGASSTFVPIEPTRVYDSRLPEPVFGTLPVGDQRLVSVRTGRDIFTGAVTEVGLVPDDATAVAYNVTVDRTIGTGFLTVSPGYATAPKASTINWTESGQTVANAGIVQIDEFGRVRVFVGGLAGGTDFIVDITGYYV
jgi:hypothetical protein